MTRAARSLITFAVYLLVVGAWLLLAPNTFLSIFGLPDVTDVWIRVLGMILLILAFYYTLAARAELTRFIAWTAYARASVIVFFAAFVWLQMVSPVLLVFGVVDLLAAVWTASALRADSSRGAQ